MATPHGVAIFKEIRPINLRYSDVVLELPTLLKNMRPLGTFLVNLNLS